MKRKGYIVIDTDHDELVDGNHPGSVNMFLSKVVADMEVDYLNNEAPSAQFRNRYALHVINFDTKIIAAEKG